MGDNKILIICLLYALVISVSDSQEATCKANRTGFTDTHSETVRIYNRIGYNVTEHYVRVHNGKATLSLIRVTNPLINKGEAGLPGYEPLLFIHGFMANANCFSIINDNVEPKNYTSHDFSSLTADELEKLFEGDRGSQSLVFTALNFGYEVWLLNRRSTFESRTAHALYGNRPIPATHANYRGSYRTLANEYWDFNFDDQARYDIPETIDYVLKKTGKEKLILVGYSAGTTLTFMALTDKPELADKISKALLWAPVLDMGMGIFLKEVDEIVKNTLPMSSKFRGPIPSPYVVDGYKMSVYLSCKSRFLRPKTCDAWIDSLVGRGTSQVLVEPLKPSNHWADTGSRTEKIQYYQSYANKQMHYFDFYDKKKNMKAYNQSKPPIYDISRIKLNSMNLWFGNTDTLARLENFHSFTEKRLTVPFKKTVIGGSGIYFNHIGFLLHKHVNRLLIIPSLKYLKT